MYWLSLTRVSQPSQIVLVEMVDGIESVCYGIVLWKLYGEATQDTPTCFRTGEDVMYVLNDRWRH